MKHLLWKQAQLTSFKNKKSLGLRIDSKVLSYIFILKWEDTWGTYCMASLQPRKSTKDRLDFFWQLMVKCTTGPSVHCFAVGWHYLGQDCLTLFHPEHISLPSSNFKNSAVSYHSSSWPVVWLSHVSPSPFFFHQPNRHFHRLHCDPVELSLWSAILAGRYFFLTFIQLGSNIFQIFIVLRLRLSGSISESLSFTTSR